jgi:hypothetical protein
VLEGEVSDGEFDEPEADAQTLEMQDADHPARGEDGQRHAIEEQNATLRAQLSTLEARFNDLHTRLTGQGRQARSPCSEPAKPDMFANPEAYEKWLVDRATRDVQTRFQEHRQAEHAQQVDVSLAHAARGERGLCFAGMDRCILGAHEPALEKVDGCRCALPILHTTIFHSTRRKNVRSSARINCFSSAKLKFATAAGSDLNLVRYAS